MELKVRSLAGACGVALGGSLLLVGLAATFNGVADDSSFYGQNFMQMFASIYPGYGGVPTIGDSIKGGLYGFVDGAIVGAVIAWLYNRCASKCDGGDAAA